MKRNPGPPALPGFSPAQPLSGFNIAALDPSALLRTAVQAHEAGRLEEAERGYRLVVKLATRNAPAHAHLGVLLLEREQWQEGADMLGRSLDLDPRQPMMLSNRGSALMRLGRIEEALDCFHAAILLQPPAERADNYNNLGIFLQRQGLIDQAVVAYDRAITLKPRLAEAWGNRGAALVAGDRPLEALASLDKALAINPRYADVMTNRGVALYRLERHEEALAAFDAAAAIHPSGLDIHNNRALVLQALDRPDEALDSADHALALGSGGAEIHANRALALLALGRLEEALASAGRAVEMQPLAAANLNNRGMVLQAMGRDPEALEDFRRAMALDADYADAHWNASLVLIRAGQYAEGWPLFEWRWRRSGADPMPQFPCPMWLGREPLDGLTLLIHAEQGFGDTLQMLRYAAPLSAKGATVIAAVPEPLLDLARSAPGVALAARPSDLVTCDMHTPMMSLPLALGTEPDDIPADVPYLTAPPDRVEAWAARLGPSPRRRVGLAWSGNAAHRNDRNRSLALERLGPLLAADAEFHSLQKQYRPGEAERLAAAGVRDHAEALDDFSDTAGLIQQMDLVIAVDTSVAHLAGALGRPVFILLPFVADYRWGLGGDGTPWYPTARLFRQTAIGDWDRVIAAVVDAL